MWRRPVRLNLLFVVLCVALGMGEGARIAVWELTGHFPWIILAFTCAVTAWACFEAVRARKRGPPA